MTTPNFRALCAELLAGIDEYVGMNPYMRLDNAMKAARTALAEPEPHADGEVADDELEKHFRAWYHQRYGFPYYGAVPLVDLIDWTRYFAAGFDSQPADGEVAESVDIRYEFSVLDADCVEQAGGSAPSLTQALDEGRHYLASYAQDGPHTLELRRVEVLTSNHFVDVPKMVEPADGEVAELVGFLNGLANSLILPTELNDQLHSAADLLSRQTPQPVPEGSSDEELRDLWHGSDWFNEGATLREFRSIARAVLARWGRP